MQHWAHNNLFEVIFKFAATFDCPPEEICAAVGLDPDQAMAVDALVPAAKIVDAVEWCAARSGYADFGLQLGARTELRIAGLAALLAERCRSLSDFYDLVSKNLPLHTNGISFAFASEAQGAAARLVIHSRGAFQARHYAEGMLSVQTRWFRRLFGAGWAPRGVEFAHRPLAAPSSYAVAFGAPVTFSADRNALLFSTLDLAWRSERPYFKARPAFEGHLQELALIDTHDHAAHVAQMIRALLPGEARLEDVAAELAMSPRSLQRKLAEQGVSFTVLLTQARVSLAQDYLRHPGVTIAEVATRLGFAQASELSRLLRRELGAVPSSLKPGRGAAAARR